MISVQNLHFSYNNKKHFHFPDIRCENGDATLILGRSGKGKTTLLHLLALLLKPDSGDIQIDGQSVSGVGAREMSLIRGQKIGIIYQRPHFVTALTVLENILMPNYLAKKPLDKKKAGQLADDLGLTEHLHKKTNQLSQGEQQRVSIARALMNDPSVLLADEPTSSLDDDNCLIVTKILRKQAFEIGASLVVVTHDQRLKNEFSNQVFL